MKNQTIILLICITIAGIIVIFQWYKSLEKHFSLKKIFNLRKELKKIKMKKFKQEDISEDGIYIGESWNNKSISVPKDAKHVFVCGTTGSGKTVALSNFIKSSIDYDLPCLIVDGKGDIGNNSILDITTKLAKTKKKFYIINLNNPNKSDKYNPFKNANPTIIKDMLINMTDWSEEHYKLNTERYLQRLILTLYKADISMSFRNIIKNMSASQFIKISAELLKSGIIQKEEHSENVEIAKISGQIAEQAVSRFSLIAESEIGSIFDESGIDIFTAMKENAIILFILNPLGIV